MRLDRLQRAGTVIQAQFSMITNEQILKAKILIIDREEEKIKLLTAIFYNVGYRHINFTTDSKQVKEFCGHLKPDLIVLDLNMPLIDGVDMLTLLHQFHQDHYLPLLVLSNEDSLAVKIKAIKSGAKDIMHEPYDRAEVLSRIRNIIEVKILYNEIQDQNKILEDKVKERTQEAYDTQIELIQRLARAVEYRDSETGMHVVRMSQCSLYLAREVGLSEDDCELIFRASPLHDLGKIGIPDSILRKPGKLTPEEWASMKTHTTIGAELLAGSKSKFLKMAQKISLTHHERWDGTGYPHGLSGEDIPLVGRICGLCDVFDALITKRPYKEAWPFDDTVEEIKRGSDSHFDPRLVTSFLNILPQFKEVMLKYQDHWKNGK